MTEQERYEAMYDEIVDLKNTINRQRTEIDYLRNEYIPMLEKNLRETDKLGMEYTLENARLQAEIERKEKEVEAFARWNIEYQTETYELRKSLLSRENLEESFSKSVKQFDKRLEKTVKLERAEAVKECIEKIKSRSSKAVMTEHGIPVAGSASYSISEVELYKIEKEMAGET